jgi:thiol-disulfide isomerase/thioredoxin
MKLIHQFKKNWFSFLLIIIIAVILFAPGAKAFVLHGLIKTGLFNAGTKKENIVLSNPERISFTDENGVLQNLAAIKGKVIFINFWAAWCPPCVAEMPTINALYNKLKNNKHFIFIMADADNDLKKSLSFMKTNNYNLPVYTLQQNIPVSIFNGTLPTTIIIGPDGNIAQKHEGIANYDTDSMINFLSSL